MRFVKMHGIGNDYVFMDSFTGSMPDNPAALAIRMSQPHFGIGADGLILIMPSDKADARMRIYNADGSEAQICGNGLRCVGKYLYDAGICAADYLTVETGAGVRALEMHIVDGKVAAVTADMGIPRLEPKTIPVIAQGAPVVDFMVSVLGRDIPVTCVSMGNPHAIVFDLWPDDELFLKLGPAMERHPAFPQRTNVEFVQVLAPDKLRVRVWERGSGETLACGSGACASLVAASLTGRAGRHAEVILPGGSLDIGWRTGDDRVYMKGPATTVFAGEWPDN